MLVAVKRLNKGTETERVNNFLAEVGIVSHMNHPNIAKLVGVCVEGGEYLVLELSALGSLSNILHGNSVSCFIYCFQVSTRLSILIFTIVKLQSGFPHNHTYTHKHVKHIIGSIHGFKTNQDQIRGGDVLMISSAFCNLKIRQVESAVLHSVISIFFLFLYILLLYVYFFLMKYIH